MQDLGYVTMFYDAVHVGRIHSFISDIFSIDICMFYPRKAVYLYISVLLF